MKTTTRARLPGLGGRHDRTRHADDRAPRDLPRRAGAGAAAHPAGYPTEGSSALRPQPAHPAQAPESGPRLRAAPPLPVLVPRAPFILLVLALVVGGVLGILVLNTKINENAFRLHDLRQRQAELDRRQQQLEQRLAEHEAPNNLAARACELGLVPAGTPAFIQLPGGQVIGEPQPAPSPSPPAPAASASPGDPSAPGRPGEGQPCRDGGR